MAEEFTIQCEHCGTTYIDLEEVCPYCGQPPSPVADGDSLLPPETDYPEMLPDQDDFLAEPDPLPYTGEPPLEEEYLEPVDEAYLAGEPLDPLDDYGPEEYLEPDDEYPAGEPPDPLDAPYSDDPGQAWPEEPDEYSALYEPFDELYDDEYGRDDVFEAEEGIAPGRFSKRRLALGCLGLLLCAGLFYGGIGLLGAYHGLQERAQLTRLEAETHYQTGQEHLANGSLELAIAEFERALNLNPNYLAAREALREAQRVSQSQPTPTSETRSAAAAEILAAAEEQMAQEKWAEAAETLAQVRGLDSDYQADRVSELLYAANYQLGLQLLAPAQVEEAVLAFEQALGERPDDPEVNVELAKALLYIEGETAENNDRQKAVEAFSELYQQDPRYLDVKQRLSQAYEAYGDELLDQAEWCLAEAQYVEAVLLQPDAALQAKAESSQARCQNSSLAQVTATPPARAQATTSAAVDRSGSPASSFDTGTQAPITATTSAEPAATGGGSIYYSAFNPFESRWEILSVPARGGAPRAVVLNGTMPAVSPDGQWLVYRSEAIESEGFHRFDFTTGEDSRITIARQHVLPRWGGDSNRFVFVAQEPATNRWQIFLGFTDGKSDPIILRDGRTPDWSPDNSLIAYQGTDPEGNQPGIYIVPFGGGEAIRLTNHQSDRMPRFSPDGSQLVYMSTRNGNWDIYTVSTAGSAPRQLTTAPGNDGLPVWSPDGSQIAYVSDMDGSWGVYVINAAGGTPTKVTAWDGNRPDWLLAQIWWAR